MAKPDEMDKVENKEELQKALALVAMVTVMWKMGIMKAPVAMEEIRKVMVSLVPDEPEKPVGQETKGAIEDLLKPKLGGAANGGSAGGIEAKEQAVAS